MILHLAALIEEEICVVTFIASLLYFLLFSTFGKNKITSSLLCHYMLVQFQMDARYLQIPPQNTRKLFLMALFD